MPDVMCTINIHCSACSTQNLQNRNLWMKRREWGSETITRVPESEYRLRSQCFPRPAVQETPLYNHRAYRSHIELLFRAEAQGHLKHSTLCVCVCLTWAAPLICDTLLNQSQPGFSHLDRQTDKKVPSMHLLKHLDHCWTAVWRGH